MRKFQQYSNKVETKITEVLASRFFKNKDIKQNELRIKSLLKNVKFVSNALSDAVDEKEYEEYELWKHRFFPPRPISIQEIIEKYFRNKRFKTGSRGRKKAKFLSLDYYFPTDNTKDDEEYKGDSLEDKAINSPQYIEDSPAIVGDTDTYDMLHRLAFQYGGKDIEDRIDKMREKLKEHEELSTEDENLLKTIGMHTNKREKKTPVTNKSRMKKRPLKGQAVRRFYGFKWIKNNEIKPFQNYGKEFHEMVIKSAKKSLVAKFRLFPSPQKFILDYNVNFKTFYRWESEGLIKGEILRFLNRHEDKFDEQFIITYVDPKIEQRFNLRGWKKEVAKAKNISIDGAEKIICRTINRGIRDKEFFETVPFSAEELRKIDEEYKQCRYKRNSE